MHYAGSSRAFITSFLNTISQWQKTRVWVRIMEIKSSEKTTPLDLRVEIGGKFRKNVRPRAGPAAF